jgi:hypothetical protein
MKEKDIQLMYREFNRYFSYKLPAVDIRITRANSYFGSALLFDDNSMAIYFGKPLLLEHMPKNKRITWESILLHEMVHIWEYVNGIHQKGTMHSAKFMDKLRAVERLSGIPQYWNFEHD